MKHKTRFLSLLAILTTTLTLSGCAETELASHYWKKVTLQKAAPQKLIAKGSYKIGTPYKVGSVWYYPEESFDLVETGIASWYGPDFHGKVTANGETYNQNALTAAHRTLQMPSFVRVTNLENGRSVVLRVNDRGPYKHGRVIDLSKRSAELLGYAQKGTARVRIQVLTEESRKVAALAKRGVDTSKFETLADLQRMGDVNVATAQPAEFMTFDPPARNQPAPYPQYPTLQNNAEMLPESLQTPTITIEEIQPPGTSPTASSWQAPIPKSNSAHWPTPDIAVSTRPINATRMFVQAGAFTVYDNALRLQERLSGIAHTYIEPTTIRGRQFYRVKLGPIESVYQADSILEKVINTGQSGAKIVGTR